MKKYYLGNTCVFLSFLLFFSYRLEISGGLGALAGQCWRIGLMGNNATPENVDLTLKVLKEGILHAKKAAL